MTYKVNMFKIVSISKINYTPVTKLNNSYVETRTAEQISDTAVRIAKKVRFCIEERNIKLSSV